MMAWAEHGDADAERDVDLDDDEWGVHRPMMFTVEPGWGWFAISVLSILAVFGALTVVFLGALG